MRLVAIGTTIKYQGKRYYPNVPFELDGVEKIPQELVGLVEEYVEKQEEVKQFQSNRKQRKNDGLLIKDEDNVETSPTPKKRQTRKPRTPKAKQTEAKEEVVNSLEDDLLNLEDDILNNV